MKTTSKTAIRLAVLYVRVSTDEQAEKGYSQKHQSEKLRQYCSDHNIEIVKEYWEDHSAKSFNRPEFNKLLQFISRNKNLVNLLLFLKWDRFSRNTSQAYMMIEYLHKLGVEPQAIEQALDLRIPENKIMLAIYLATPEVENDRRSLNVIAGMRKALMEGRWVYKAPLGYRNTRSENNTPSIVPDKNAPLIRWVYEEAAKGILPVYVLWKQARQKGLKCCINHFWNILRNPFYTSRILVPAHENETEFIVRGKHKSIIPVSLFNAVQHFLKTRERKYSVKPSTMGDLFLRGFLKCKKCGGRLSGSGSTGNGGKYFYYHCTKGCNERFRADVANQRTLKILGSYIVNKEALNACIRTIENSSTEQSRVELKNYNIKRKKNRRQLDSNLDQYVKFCIEMLDSLELYFMKGDLQTKQVILKWLFPNKLIFDTDSFRTINSINYTC